jgi:hypothetical protein
MNISHVTNAVKVGEIKLDPTYSKKLLLVKELKLTKEDFTNNTGRVYFITVNGVIKKIGGSQCKGGIQSTIGAYLSGFAKGMSARTYCVWNYLRQQVVAGNQVEFYFILAPMIKAKIPLMSIEVEVDIAVDFHQIETACVKEYYEIEKEYPYLNIQESGKKWTNTGLLEGYPG